MPPEWRPGQPCVIDGGRARYLRRVLRLETGQAFPGIDAEGRRWLCTIEEAGPEGLVLSAAALPADWEAGHLEDLRGGREARRRTDGDEATEAEARAVLGLEPAPEAAPRPLPAITLVQGLPKGAKMDQIVRQATEAGVTRIVPLLARRSSAPDASLARLDRWRRIAREALQQSGSPTATRIEGPVDVAGLAAALGAARSGRLCLFLDAEAPLAQSSLHEYLTDAPDEIVLCVGPEGGFEAEEARTLAEAGFFPLRLPCAVLRTETAALYAVAAVEIVLSERPSWIPRAR